MQITYYKTDPKDSKKTICPSDAEVDILLQANAQDGPWKMELARRNHAIVVEQRKRIVRVPHSSGAGHKHPPIQTAYKAYQERKAAVRNLEGF